MTGSTSYDRSSNAARDAAGRRRSGRRPLVGRHMGVCSSSPPTRGSRRPLVLEALRTRPTRTNRGARLGFVRDRFRRAPHRSRPTRGVHEPAEDGRGVERRLHTHPIAPTFTRGDGGGETGVGSGATIALAHARQLRHQSRLVVVLQVVDLHTRPGRAGRARARARCGRRSGTPCTEGRSRTWGRAWRGEIRGVSARGIDESRRVTGTPRSLVAGCRGRRARTGCRPRRRGARPHLEARVRREQRRVRGHDERGPDRGPSARAEVKSPEVTRALSRVKTFINSTSRRQAGAW